MKVVILAGGLGTRLGEETHALPKPMVEIGGQPILWHIMKIYSHYGFNDFLILCGYRTEIIKNFFVNYYMNNSDITIDLATNVLQVHKNTSEPWKVTLVDTGLNTLTGGRIKRAQKLIGDEPFMLTYGDGVADIDINALLAFHKNQEKLVTLSAIQPEGRFGVLDINKDCMVSQFKEKPKIDTGWINGGFFVCQPEIFDYIPDGDDIIWEQDPLINLSNDNQLSAFKHSGFWHAMDMLKDKIELNDLWERNEAPWKIWKK